MEGNPKERSIRLARTLDGLRRSGELCDVVLLVGERRFTCHRSALAVSPVFAAMFTGPLKESKEREVPMEEVEMHPETFEQLLRFIYGSDDFQLNDQNAWQLLFAANRFGVRQLVVFCVKTCAYPA